MGQGASTATQGLALADLDADGDADLVTANTSGDANRIVVNGSNGGSLTSSQTLGSNDSGDVALADLDGDGDRDSVFANLASTGNTVYTNDGSGSFSDTGQSLGSATSRAVALGDLDGDGNADAVFGNDGGNNVYLGRVSGDFTSGASGLGNADTRAVAVVDTDGDGDRDIVAANDDAALQIWHNDGAAQFSKGPSVAVAKARAVAAVDLNADGVEELYIGRIGPNRVAERSGGSWTLRSRKLGYHNTRDVAAGDIDGDGTPDVVTAQNSAAQQVWLTKDAGRIRLKQASYSAAEGDGSVTIKLERTGPAGTASIDYATQDGSAVAVDDYTTASGTVSWSAGSTSDKTVSVSLTADSTAEPAENFKFKLNNLTGSGSAPEPELGTPSEATVTITGESTDAGEIALASGTSTVAESTGQVTLTVTRFAGAGSASVDFATQDDTASAGNDYTANTGTLSWADGETGDRTITVNVAADGTNEPDEAFRVKLSNVSGSGSVDAPQLGSPAQATVTIAGESTDAGEIALASGTSTVAESTGQVTLTVTRSAGAGSASVDFATQDDTASAGNDYTANTGTLSWADGETGDRSITIDVAADGEKEPDEAFQVKLDNVTGSGSVDAPQLGSPGEATITIAGQNLVPQFSGRDLTTEVNTAVSVDLAASDPNGDSISYAVTSDPGHGTAALTGASLTYTPNAGYTGGDRFEVTASDGQGGATVAVMSVIVTDGGNRAPNALDRKLDVGKNETGSVTVVATDPDGDSLAYSLAQMPENGLATLDGSEATYTPELGYTGTDRFKIEVADGRGKQTTARIKVDVGNSSGTDNGGGGGCTVARGAGGGLGPLWALLLLGPWAWQRRCRGA